MTSFGDPFLKIGITFAILFLSGKIPCVKEALQISESGLHISSTAILISMVGIWQDPDALEASRFCIRYISIYYHDNFYTHYHITRVYGKFYVQTYVIIYYKCELILYALRLQVWLFSIPCNSSYDTDFCQGREKSVEAITRY